MSDADHTVEADDSELERIRRLVAQEKLAGDAGSDALLDDPYEHTTEADAETFERIRAIATGQTPAKPAGGTFAPPPAPAADPLPVPIEEPPAEISPGAGRSLPTTPAAPADIGDVTVPPPRKAVPAEAGAWVPPARSVRPEPEVKQPEPTVRRWRLATLILTVLLVALVVAWAVFGRGSEAPPSTTVPGSDVGVSTTIAAGNEGESSG